MNPTVFIRSESIDRITEVQIQAVDFLHGNWGDLDALFWRHLTPSASAGHGATGTGTGITPWGPRGDSKFPAGSPRG
jgi:hypothetical protein